MNSYSIISGCSILKKKQFEYLCFLINILNHMLPDHLKLDRQHFVESLGCPGEGLLHGDTMFCQLLLGSPRLALELLDCPLLQTHWKISDLGLVMNIKITSSSNIEKRNLEYVWTFVYIIVNNLTSFGFLYNSIQIKHSKSIQQGVTAWLLKFIFLSY